ncbi:hypothetical protein BJN34_0325 [Cupriavidus necator]|uniref:Transposase n=1 Tax=Cupriavidus necator TaxID=106590 RepID=A0A2P1DV19_CUPNE|nr:hypothetical protein BJN34_0325 [Cupriavidus necator]
MDHTLADISLIDEVHRVPTGRAWLTLAVDVATRCVAGMHVAMHRPNAATVALLLESLTRWRYTARFTLVKVPIKTRCLRARDSAAAPNRA